MHDTGLKIDFHGEKLSVHLGKYMGYGNPAMQLYDAELMPYMTASVNPEYKLKPGQILIKNYGENEGILNALIDAKIISWNKEDVVSVGYTIAYLCKLLIGEETEPKRNIPVRVMGMVVMMDEQEYEEFRKRGRE